MATKNVRYLRTTCVLFYCCLISSCATISPPSISSTKSQQVLIVKPVKDFYATLEMFEYVNNSWQLIMGPLPAVVGRSGIALAGVKKEGDGFTPSGIFDLPFAFGYNASIETGLDYRQATDEDFWVDDVNAAQYNQWVHGKPQAQSYEVLRRNDVLYRQAIVIGYNMSPIVKGAGSAIFLHHWKNYHHSTSGCVAISQRHLRKLMAKLDKNKNPMIEIYP